MNNLKSWKQNSGRMDKRFMVLGDPLEREVIYRTYVLGGHKPSQNRVDNIELVRWA